VSDTRRVVWICAGVIAALLGVQAIAVIDAYYLVIDDWMLIAAGREVPEMSVIFGRTRPGPPTIRPVSILLARGEHLLFADAAYARLVWHLTQHAAACGLLALALNGLGATAREAGVAAVLFAAWPQNGEVIAWYHSGHTSIPMSLMLLTSLTAHIRRWPMWALLLPLIAALLTRENAVMFAPIALCVSVWRTRRFFPALRDMWPIIAVVGIFVAFRLIQFIPTMDEQTTSIPLGNPLTAALHIGFNLAIPVQPGIDHSWIWLGACAAGMALLLFRRRADLWAAGLWIAIWSLPFMPVYATTDALFDPAAPNFERLWYHLYLPSMALAWLAARELAPHTKRIAVVVVCLTTLQTINARWFVELGELAHDAHAAVDEVLSEQRPTVFEFPQQDVGAQLVETQIWAANRVFDRKHAPIYRLKPDADGYMRALRDSYTYPVWVEVPDPSLIPADALRVRWSTATRTLERLP